MLREHLLDAREMAPPEPLDLASEVLVTLRPGQYLRMLHRRIPYPLFDLCNELSLAYSVEQKTGSSYVVIVYCKDDYDLLVKEGIL